MAIAVKSPNALMQLEAVRAIAHLAAANDKMKAAVVEGPLQTVIGMHYMLCDVSGSSLLGLLIDPHSDSSLQLASETVLKNLGLKCFLSLIVLTLKNLVGFTHGVKDLELCQFDFHLLRDWYYIKSWVLTQTYGALLLNDWMLDLFRQ